MDRRLQIYDSDKTKVTQETAVVVFIVPAVRDIYNRGVVFFFFYDRRNNFFTIFMVYDYVYVYEVSSRPTIISYVLESPVVPLTRRVVVKTMLAQRNRILKFSSENKCPPSHGS